MLHVFFMLTKMRRDEVKPVSPSSFPGAYFTVISVFCGMVAMSHLNSD